MGKASRDKGRRGQQEAQAMLKDRGDYYVYLHRRATDGSVFYVGKGRGDRAWVHASRRNPHWRAIAEKHGYFVEIHMHGLQQWYAYELEVQLIASISLTERLANKTTGGDGGYQISECAKKKMSLAKKGKPGRKMPAYVKQKLSEAHKGKKLSREHIEIMRQARTGKKQTIETRLKKSKSLLGRKRSKDTLIKMNLAKQKAVVCIETGDVFASQKAAADWVRDHTGNQKANNRRINSVVLGETKTAYGYHWRFADGVKPKAKGSERSKRRSEFAAIKRLDSNANNIWRV